MLRGLTTVNLVTADMPAAMAWYTELLGVEPYFVRPVDGPPLYVEFRVGDYQHELGLLDSRYAPHGAPQRPDGAIVFWHVDDLPAVHERLLSMGATEHDAPTTREAGFVTASVVDPFGNVLGIMYNPHYLDVLGSFRAL